jgi:TPP-dependent indolepyruvate ferredoxin oxidoreductase alpha subunit
MKTTTKIAITVIVIAYLSITYTALIFDRIISNHSVCDKCKSCENVCGKNKNVTEPRDFGHFQNWFK